MPQIHRHRLRREIISTKLEASDTTTLEDCYKVLADIEDGDIETETEFRLAVQSLELVYLQLTELLNQHQANHIEFHEAQFLD